MPENPSLIQTNATQASIPFSSQSDPSRSNRKHPRFNMMIKSHWSLFSESSGIHLGYVENLSEGGCLLRANEVVEHRRWIRIIMNDKSTGLWLTAVGRVIRRQDKLEHCPDNHMSLYRYGVEFIHPVNSKIFEQMDKGQCCSKCGCIPATIPDTQAPGKRYCTLCHLRRTCQDLIEDDFGSLA